MDISQVATEQLEAELVAHAAWETAGLARMLVVLAEFDRRQAWASWGCRNAQQWLSWKCGLGYNAASERLRVAHHLETLPAIRHSFTHGQITWSKVREITRVATPASETEYVDLARHMTASQLSTVVRAKRRVSAADAVTQHATRAFSWFTDTDGSVTVTVKLPAEHAVPIINAVNSATQFTAGTPRAALLADTFRQLVSQQITATTTVTVHVDADNCTVENGPPIALEIAEQIACNHGATLTTNSHTSANTNTSTHADTAAEQSTAEQSTAEQSTARTFRASPRSDTQSTESSHDSDHHAHEGEVVLDRRRTATKRQRNWIARRHPTCQFPGCHHAGTFEVHHVQHHANGGRSTINNYARLCEHHHRYTHLHHLTLTMTATRDLIVTLPNGAPLDRAIERLNFDPPEPTDPNQIGDNWYNDRFNLDYIISVLIHNETIHQQRTTKATATAEIAAAESATTETATTEGAERSLPEQSGCLLARV